MRKFVAIDTQPFIWGIKMQSSVGQESMVPKTIAFFDYLYEEGYNVMIPSPVLGEVLAPVPLEEHYTVLSKINRRMLIASFDPQAAAKFAHMFRSYKNNRELVEYKEQHCIPRERIRIDYMISAIALANKAECIYSHDVHIKKFATPFIDVKEIPVIGVQGVIDFTKKDRNEENKPIDPVEEIITKIFRNK